MTLLRYFAILGVQSTISLFSVLQLYFRREGDGGARRRPRKYLLLSGLVVSLLIGVTMGYGTAVDQYRFADG